MRKMNEIEKRFFDAYMDYHEDEQDLDQFKAGVVIGPYEVDFCIVTNFCKFVIEIDGHEFHKTKEQRDKDYKRERYLMKEGYMVVRFMGTEVFLDATKCVEDFEEIITPIESRQLDLHHAEFICKENGIRY